jgi:hypothetical protein
MPRLAFRLIAASLALFAAGLFGYGAFLDSASPPALGRRYLDREALREESLERQGREAATHAIASGQLRLLQYGPVSPTMVRLAQERFGVVLEPGPWCALSVRNPSFTFAYNEAMEAHIAGLFGPHWLESCRREATLLESQSQPPCPDPTPHPTPAPNKGMHPTRSARG